MKRYIPIIPALLILFVASLCAQPVDEFAYDRMLETAESELAKNEYYNALEWFEKCYDEQPDDLRLSERLAYVQYLLRDFKRAENWYSRLLRKDKERKFELARYYYGRVLKMNGKTDQARLQFQRVLDTVQDSDLRTKTLNEIEGINLADTLKEDISVVVENAGRKVNSAFSEFSPFGDREGRLYFGSFQRKEVIVLDGKEDDYHAKIYVSAKDKDGDYDKPKALSNEINREDFHTANISLSPDGKRMFFTRTVLSGNQAGETKIYVSFEKGENWSGARELTGVNGDWIATHPCVGELYGNEVLFFVSNMPGGKGGYDIYYANRINDTEYGTPVNLGDAINTVSDEITPFYIDGTLFFSSEGHPSIGGFDIFTTTWNGSSWSPVKNMGMGYNSTYDDLYYRALPEAEKGHLVSNRPGTTVRSLKSKTCCDDIWTVEVQPIVVDLLAVTFDESGKPLVGATISLIDMTGNREGGMDQKSNPKGNVHRFLLDLEKPYKVRAERPGYYPAELQFNTVGTPPGSTVKKELRLKAMPVKHDVEIITIYEPIPLNNIYYDFDDDKILPDAEKDLRVLVELMQQYPEMVIELLSHTDSRGNDAYNQRLSERRANSAKDWMVERGIDEDRIVAIGYGEAKIQNQCVNGVQCTEEEHRVNRRTEFRIIEGPTTIEVKKEKLRNTSRQGGSQGVGSSGQQPSKAVPVIRFEKQVYDLGEVKAGEKRKARLVFSNTGSAPYVIEYASACECTELKWPDKPVAPGAKAILEIEYNSEGKSGLQEIGIEMIGNTDPFLVETKFIIRVID